MKGKNSAGLLLYRWRNSHREYFLVHPGGPFWKNKDDGSWSIPKGEFFDGEDPFDAAVREFTEETGFVLQGNYVPLNPVTMKSGKTVYTWAIEADVDADNLQSNEFEMEWPPKSGRLQRFPEVDRAAWFTADIAILKLNQALSTLVRQVEN